MHITLNQWLLIAGASWTILACVVALPIGRAMAKAGATEAAEHVNWLPFLPPVPPSPRQWDEAWLDIWPVAASDDEETRLRFDQIVAAERWAA